MLPDTCALVAANGRQIVVSDCGDPQQGEPYTGIYSSDHQFLSGVDITVKDDHKDIPNDVSDTVPDKWLVLGREVSDGSVITTLASEASGPGRGTQRPWILTKRYSIVEDGVELSVSLQNTTTDTQQVTLEVTITPDFRHVFEVSEFFSPRDQPERPLCLEQQDTGIKITAMGADGENRSVRIDSQDSLIFDVRKRDVTARSTVSVPATNEQTVTIQLSFSDRDLTAPDFALDTEKRPYRHLAEAATQTLRALTLPSGVPAAGAPRFLAAFGRDALIVGYQLLQDDPTVAKRILRFLAAKQGTEYDSATLEAPGRIMHEYRVGDLPKTGGSVRAPYYGTVDATPLFISLYTDVLAQTADKSLKTELYPNVVAATEHLLDELDSSGLLFYEPHDHPLGLTHLGWKDSAEALARPDGMPACGSVALAEAQGYAYRALNQIVPLAQQHGDDKLATTCLKWKTRIADVFEDRFWLPDEECYALGVDDDGVIDSVASNQTHAFWCGLGTDDRVTRAVDRLLEPDMLTPAGLRTFAGSHAAFDPLSYHRGSVWPHDTSIAAMGFAARGHTNAAAMLSKRTLSALEESHLSGAPDRYGFPELMVGTNSNHASIGSLSHPDACEPAAWSAGSVFAFRRYLGGEY